MHCWKRNNKDTKNSRQFTKRILEWYPAFGRKNLPWKQNTDPYRIWLSEIILQQTQVSVAASHFPRIVHEYPTIFHLARASMDTILFAWSGLGLYLRAHNLHKTANIIVERYRGVFPNEFDVLVKLPGIGRSTAGAILSFAWGQRRAVLDTNVKRVLLRYYAPCGGARHTEQTLWRLVDDCLPHKHASNFNQAVMDLGATVCGRAPKCHKCPVLHGCRAYLDADWTRWKRRKRLQDTEKSMHLLVLSKNGCVRLKRRSDERLWRGLFCFPEFESTQTLQLWLKRNDVSVASSWSKTLVHRLGRCVLRIHLHGVAVDRNARFGCGSDELWYDTHRPQKIGIPVPIRNALINLGER